ncbi:YibE/F family protein [Paractinoplanes atraurantiacus]|nr:YibE/F family protein [Actinoplanes atraurantiacus]
MAGRHAHSHDQLPEMSRRAIAAILIPAAIATLIAMIVLWPARTTPPTSENNRVEGTVTAIDGRATVRLDDGTETSAEIGKKVRVGDQVVLLHTGPDYAIVDHQRSTPMIGMLALTVAVILAFGRWRGLTSLAGLAVSFAVLLLFIIPAILDGSPPLLVAVVGASAIMFAALYLTHGISTHTSVAVAGTLASLVLTGLLGAGFTAALHLTGVATDDDAFLSATLGGIDMRGLLLAGIVIGALGVLDDVTVTQAVTVAEMSAGASGWALYRAAIRVGRAHVGSAVNTIVLAYAGASLPLLLLFSTGTQPAGDLLTGELLAQEILRSAVGTIGLVASVPLTTALAVLAAGRSHRFT